MWKNCPTSGLASWGKEVCLPVCLSPSPTRAPSGPTDWSQPYFIALERPEAQRETCHGPGREGSAASKCSSSWSWGARPLHYPGPPQLSVQATATWGDGELTRKGLNSSDTLYMKLPGDTLPYVCVSSHPKCVPHLLPQRSLVICHYSYFK